MNKKTHPKEYETWLSMRNRCRKGNKAARTYFERGISVCKRWDSFKNFLLDMGPRPSGKLSLDRIDNNAGYFPENCRWVSQKEQCRNKSNNTLIKIDRKLKTQAEWCEVYGISVFSFKSRLRYGWPVKSALELPIGSRLSINKHGVNGCFFRRGRWESRITVNKKSIYLGTFKTKSAAAKAYLRAKENVRVQK